MGEWGGDAKINTDSDKNQRVKKLEITIIIVISNIITLIVINYSMP